MVEIKLAVSGALAIILGLLVLIFPKVLRFALGLYLIVFGILSFF